MQVTEAGSGGEGVQLIRMALGWSDEAVGGEGTVEIHCQHPAQASRNEGRLRVDEVRWKVWAASETAEEVADEEQAVAWTQEAHVPDGMAGEMVESVAAGSGDPSPSCRSQSGDVPSVVQVAVSQNDASDR